MCPRIERPPLVHRGERRTKDHGRLSWTDRLDFWRARWRCTLSRRHGTRVRPIDPPSTTHESHVIPPAVRHSPGRGPAAWGG